MRREPGWNHTLLVAKPADPPDSGIRNPHSSQRCLLVPEQATVDCLWSAPVGEVGHRPAPAFRFHENMSFIGATTCPSACQQEASVLAGSCRPYKDLLLLRRNNAFLSAAQQLAF
jgi:hypothetical protein